MVVIAILSDLISSNRKIIEEALWRIRRMENKDIAKDEGRKAP